MAESTEHEKGCPQATFPAAECNCAELAEQQALLDEKKRERQYGKSPVTSARAEIARIQEIADKYRIGTSPDLKRTIARDFIIWLAKENIALCNREDIVTTREAFDLIEEYCND